MMTAADLGSGGRGVAHGSSFFAAALFDLDGVITRTESLHFAAWKRTIDDFLGRTESVHGGSFSEADYHRYVDGRPRQEGLRRFFAARGLAVPQGLPDEGAEADTVAGLAARKSSLFEDLLERRGVEVDGGALDLLQRLKSAGLPIGICSSSRHAVTILHRAGLTQLFDGCIDGNESARLGLPGKPAPDIFLECLRRLGSFDPRRVILLEDAAAGVAAGKAGRFGLIIGVDRGGNALRLRQGGADIVTDDLGRITFDVLAGWATSRKHLRPNPLADWSVITTRAAGRRLALFLDYDGTLTPIVDRPEQAVLTDEMRAILRRAAAVWPTHVLSGRALDDVRDKLGVDSIWCAGSHGFELEGPEDGRRRHHVVMPELASEIEAAASELGRRLTGITGVLVENKRFSVAVHHRLVADQQVADVERAVDVVVAGHAKLRKTGGKKVFELRPAFDWDKGKALQWLMTTLHLQDAMPIYIGDDITDEDAFEVVRESGMGILVTDVPRPTAATLWLQEPREVTMFLEHVAAMKERGG